MTTLAAPPTWNQFAQGYTARNSCGAHAVASSLVGAGLLPAATALATVEADIGLGETSDTDLVRCLQRHGATGAHSLGNDYGAIASTLRLGFYVIPLVQSDGNGHLVPLGSTNIDHWLVQYADDDGMACVANSGSGKDETYPAAYFSGAYAGITIDTGCAAPATGGDPMTDPEKGDIASALVQGWYDTILHRDADEDIPGRDYWYQQIMAHGFGATYRAFRSSDEAKAAIAAEAKG